LSKRKYKSLLHLNNPPEECCRKENLSKSRELSSFLKHNFQGNEELKIWDTREYEKSPYTAWWVSFSNDSLYKEKLFMALGFTIFENSISVYFRFMDAVNKEEFGLIDWHKGDEYSEYVSFEKNKNRLANSIKKYLESIRKNIGNGTMRNFRDFQVS
jgi:hypothetical protein